MDKKLISWLVYDGIYRLEFEDSQILFKPNDPLELNEGDTVTYDLDPLTVVSINGIEVYNDK